MKILYIPTFNKVTDIDLYFKDSDTLLEQDPDVILVSGGDGSLLHAIQNYKFLEKPFLGVAAGTKNFLLNKITLEEIKSLENMDLSEFERTYEFEKVSALKVIVNRKCSNGCNNIVFRSEVINDIVLGGSIMDYNVFNVKNYSEENIKGMGLLISTPLGSTAFNINNGGKVIKHLDSSKVSFATIVADLNFEKIIPYDSIGDIVIKSERSTCSLFIDGTTKIFNLKYGDIISVSKSNSTVIGIKNKEAFREKRLNH